MSIDATYFPAQTSHMGTLYYGDNLPILRDHIKDESVDLVYLDPPFKSDANYNAFFQGKSGASASQIMAFEDTWHWVNKDNESMSEFQKMLGDARMPNAVRKLLQAYHDFLGGCDMMAYLMMMSPRLVELKRVLKPTGSLYLHCDPTASHFLKLLLDAVFGPENFVNEISWKRTTTKSDYKQGAFNWPRIHDVILYYAKSGKLKPMFKHLFPEYDEEYVKTKYRYTEPDGRKYRLDKLTAPGMGSRGHPQYEFLGVTRYWVYNKEKMEKLHQEGRVVQTRPGAVVQYKRYLDEVKGVAIGDFWPDISAINSMAKERLHYPTQKPLALLERILQASSNPSDLVLDPFCGCGTTIDAAEKHDRQWIGIDITQIAMTTIKKRLWDTYHEVKTVRFMRGSDAPQKDGETKSGANELVVRVIGEPATSEDAAAMAKEDPYGFQWWAAGLVGGQGAEEKKRARMVALTDASFFTTTQNPPPARKLFCRSKAAS